MKKILISFVFFLPVICNAQFRQYDVVEKVKAYKGHTEIVYLTALWCHPCMVKLKPVIDSFGNKNDMSLTVLFDYYGMSPSVYQKLAAKFDTSFFRVLPYRYYTSAKKAIIRVNPSNKVFKALHADFNSVHGTKFDMDTMWVGMAIIRNAKGIVIAKGDTAEELIADIKLKSHSN